MRASSVVSLVAVAVITVVACSASEDPNGFDPDSDSDSDGQPSGSGAGSGDPSGGQGGALDVDAGGNPDGSDACAAVSHTAKGVPLDMLMMVDQSGSMDDEVPGGDKWTAVTKAITGFVSQSPETDGIGVGIQYFPLVGTLQPCPSSCMDCACLFSQCNCTSCSCTNNVCQCLAQGGGSSCVVSDYQTPEVEIGVLPGNKDPILQSLAKHGPSGGTPTRPALEGALAHASEWAQANPDHKVIVVLATDGAPSSGECMPNEVADSAALAAAAQPGVLTFVIGVGDNLTALNQIAAAGGTMQALFVDSGGNVEQQFIDAMNSISEAALACEYVIPEPAPGDTLDYEMVNVEYTPEGGTPTKVKYVGSPAGCDPVTGGWYYDDPTDPKSIEMCPATCTTFQGDDKMKVDILLGCKTVVD